MQASSQEDVILEKVNKVGCVILNRPKQLHALNLSMIRKINPKLKEWEKDSGVQVVLIKSSGGNAFCAGGDIKAIRDSAVKGDIEGALSFFSEEYNLNYLIANLQKPYIALINGITMGGGVGLSVHGKYRVASEKTMFAMPETAIGFFPDVGGAHVLSQLKGQLGLYLALTGHRLKGLDVFYSGIATHFVSSTKTEQLEKGLFELSHFNEDNFGKLVQKLSEANRQELPECDKINSTFDAESVEAIYEKLNKLNNEWAQKQLSTMSKMSPLALKITFEQMKLAKNKNLKEILQLDYQLCQRFMKENDFVEGVRALLVDKDNKPNWQPKSVNEVSKQKVDSFFVSQQTDFKLNLLNSKI